jgi:hypothetical protein
MLRGHLFGHNGYISALLRCILIVAVSIQTPQFHRLSDSGCANRAQKFMLTAAYMQ